MLQSLLPIFRNNCSEGHTRLTAIAAGNRMPESEINAENSLRENVGKDIVLFYYYSSPFVPNGCFLGLSNDIAYRNIFLLPCPGNKIHFEFPMFEDHSYNTICNRHGVRNLIKRLSEHEKYIIFRTDGQNIIGFYRVRRAYYQETNMFNNNGFVWGIEAAPYLIRKGRVKYNGPSLRQGYRTSWQSDEWAKILTELLGKIQGEENISDIYKSETNRLVKLFKNDKKLEEWEEACIVCGERSNCRLYRQFDKYKREHPNSNMLSVLNRVYNSNLYSRNVLDKIPQIYLK